MSDQGFNKEMLLQMLEQEIIEWTRRVEGNRRVLRGAGWVIVSGDGLGFPCQLTITGTGYIVTPRSECVGFNMQTEADAKHNAQIIGGHFVAMHWNDYCDYRLSNAEKTLAAIKAIQ